MKVKMRDPEAVPDVPSTGAATYTEEDVEQMHRRLRDELPFESPRQLSNAVIENGVLIVFFETTIEPSLAECQEFYRLTARALPPFRRPTSFNCVKTYPVGTTEVGYLL